jgi:virC1 protein
MSKVITLVSTKGSVGKTALAIHIGGYLADQDKKVCFIDADSQQSLSRWFDYSENQPVNAAGFGKWFTEQVSELDEVIYHPVNHGNIDIIINDDPNKLRVAKYLRDNAGAVYKLAGMLRPLRERYDYIIVDTEGTDGRDHNGSSIQDAVMLAEPDLILSVTKTKVQFAMEVLRVVDVYRNALNAYRFIERSCAPPLKFLINEHDRNLNVSAEVLKDLQQSFAENPAFNGVELLKTIVPFKRKFFEDEHHKNKVFMHQYKDPNSYDPLNEVIKTLCEELFPELKQGV